MTHTTQNEVCYCQCHALQNFGWDQTTKKCKHCKNQQNNEEWIQKLYNYCDAYDTMNGCYLEEKAVIEFIRQQRQEAYWEGFTEAKRLIDKHDGEIYADGFDAGQGLVNDQKKQAVKEFAEKIKSKVYGDRWMSESNVDRLNEILDEALEVYEGK